MTPENTTPLATVLYQVAAEYPTEGDDAHEWGEPEQRAERALEAAGVAQVGYSSGTDLMTGVRDVQFLVEAASIDLVTEALATLPPDERLLWTVTDAEGDDDQ